MGEPREKPCTWAFDHLKKGLPITDDAIRDHLFECSYCRERRKQVVLKLSELQEQIVSRALHYLDLSIASMEKTESALKSKNLKSKGLPIAKSEILKARLLLEELVRKKGSIEA